MCYVSPGGAGRNQPYEEPDQPVVPGSADGAVRVRRRVRGGEQTTRRWQEPNARTPVLEHENASSRTPALEYMFWNNSSRRSE